MTAPIAPAEAAITAVERAYERRQEIDLGRISPAPERGPWSLWPDALQFLAALVEELAPAHVLEFGSGLSTRVLAWACAEHAGHARLSSIDNDPESSAGAKAGLSHQAQACAVSLQIAPLVIRDCGGELLPVYRIDEQALATSLPVDLAVIDGPPLLLGGREGTLYQLLGIARPGTVVVLDDAGRLAEQRILENWEASLGEAVEIRRLEELTGGMAAIVVHEPLTQRELWPHRLSVMYDRLPELVPAGETFLLVEGATFDAEFWATSLPGARTALPFPARGGEYWGPPEGDEDAITELEAARDTVGTIVFAWPALWWLDHYSSFAAHLHSQYRCVHLDPRFAVFDLR